ncbi:unnamed protein product [Orchesella dallaii]|uniref:Odorant receptor n=1 Tax=Orchesella dallaii TaxID=48710 RepID=A0ABP1QHZ6_9HEXA
MLSLESLDLISVVAWQIYERIVVLQELLWINLPLRWDSKKKRATYRTIPRCLPYILFATAQVPIYLGSFVILFRQVTPEYTDPRFPTPGAFLIAFGSLMNVFITFGALSNIYKRKEWCLCLNVVGGARFSNSKIRGKINWLQKPILRKITPVDILAHGIVGFLLTLGVCGVFIGLLQDIDPIHYVFLDVPRGTREWNILKYGVRPFFWGNWSMYCVLTFFHTVINIFFIILHGCIIIPRAPKLSHRNAFSVIPTSLSNLSIGQKLNLRLLEAAYKEYRQFQIFIRPANDAMYIVVPDGLAGLAVVSVACGVISIRGSSLLPIGMYLLYPSVGIMCVVLIIIMVPIACGVFENAVNYKNYWLSRILRREARQRLRACRPMGIAAGPFGYVQRSLPMELLNSIVDNICSIIVTFSVDAHGVTADLL